MKKIPLIFLFAAVLVLHSGFVRLSAQDVGPLAQPQANGPGPVAQPPPNDQGSYGPTEPPPDALGNVGPVAMAGTEGQATNGRTIIESQDGATFDNTSNTADFTGQVVVHDPQFDLSCDKLHVVLRPDRKGMKQVIATGRVVVTQEKKNDHGDIVKSIGKCGKATYDPATGDVSLEDWPQVQQGINNQIATEQTTIMILNAKGRSHTIGSSRTMIVDQGQKSITP